ncbi:MAG TPA: hypothetical protein PKN69_01475 [Candidatus Latescibacteria bacterium]|nr:hypothetical protein [Candidatus Latescibacterota bacterium]
MVRPLLAYQRDKPPRLVVIIRHVLEVIPLAVGNPLHVVRDGTEIEEPFIPGECVQLFRAADAIAEERLPVGIAPVDAGTGRFRGDVDRVRPPLDARFFVHKPYEVDARLPEGKPVENPDGPRIAGKCSLVDTVEHEITVPRQPAFPVHFQRTPPLGEAIVVILNFAIDVEVERPTQRGLRIVPVA